MARDIVMPVAERPERDRHVHRHLKHRDDRYPAHLGRQVRSPLALQPVRPLPRKRIVEEHDGVAAVLQQDEPHRPPAGGEAVQSPILIDGANERAITERWPPGRTVPAAIAALATDRWISPMPSGRSPPWAT